MPKIDDLSIDTTDIETLNDIIKRTRGFVDILYDLLPNITESEREARDKIWHSKRTMQRFVNSVDKTGITLLNERSASVLLMGKAAADEEEPKEIFEFKEEIECDCAPTITLISNTEAIITVGEIKTSSS